MLTKEYENIVSNLAKLKIAKATLLTTRFCLGKEAEFIQPLAREIERLELILQRVYDGTNDRLTPEPWSARL